MSRGGVALTIPTGDEWRSDLVDALKKLSVSEALLGRTALVAGIQSGLNRDPNNAWTDLTLIVDHLIKNEDADGLRILIRNALGSEPSHAQAEKLKKLLRALEGRQDDEAGARFLIRTESFDLEDPCARCIEATDGSQVLVAIAMRSRCEMLRTSLFARLVERLGRGSVYRAPTFKLAPLHISPVEALAKVKGYDRNLKGKHVLVSVEVEHEPFIPEFWKGLTAGFSYDSATKLIVVLWTDPAPVLPDGILDLGEPDFQSHHVRDWIQGVIGSLSPQSGAPHDVAKRWKEHVVQSCSRGSKQLSPDLLYQHLVEVVEALNEERSPDAIRQLLPARSQ